MAEDGSHLPEISVSRTSTASANSRNDQKPKEVPQQSKPSPWVYANNNWNPHQWRPPKNATWGSKFHNPDVEWHIKWTKDCFSVGRVLIIDYVSNVESAGSGRRHVTVAAQEFQELKDLEKFYADSKRVHGAALRVIHVQNATWATRFLLRKFNIDHASELVSYCLLFESKALFNEVSVS